MDAETLTKRLDQGYQSLINRSSVVYDLLWFMDLYPEIAAVQNSPIYLIKRTVKGVLNILKESLDLTKFGEPEAGLPKEKIIWAIDYTRIAISQLERQKSERQEDKGLLGNFYLHKALLEEYLAEKEKSIDEKILCLRDAYYDREKSGKTVESFNRVTYAQQRAFQGKLADRISSLLPQDKKVEWQRRACQNNLAYVEVMESLNLVTEGVAIAALMAGKTAFFSFKDSQFREIKEEFGQLSYWAFQAFLRYYQKTHNQKYGAAAKLAESMLKDLKKEEKMKNKRERRRQEEN